MNKDFLENLRNDIINIISYKFEMPLDKEIIKTNNDKLKKNIDTLNLILYGDFSCSEKKQFIYDDAKMFSYSIPKFANICRIARFLIEKKCLKVLEVGSGLGLWAGVIKYLVDSISYLNPEYDFNHEEFQFIATDNHDTYPIESKYYTYVEKLEAYEAIEKYNDIDCLFLCWPYAEYNIQENSSYYKSSDMLEKFKGKYIIYIGSDIKIHEDQRHTADNKFYDIINGPDWKQVKIMDNMKKYKCFLYAKGISGLRTDEIGTDDFIYIFENIKNITILDYLLSFSLKYF